MPGIADILTGTGAVELEMFMRSAATPSLLVPFVKSVHHVVPSNFLVLGSTLQMSTVDLSFDFQFIFLFREGVDWKHLNTYLAQESIWVQTLESSKRFDLSEPLFEQSLSLTMLRQINIA